MTTTIGQIFDLTVKRFPNKEAIYDVRKNVRYTYKEWSEQVNRLANALVKEGVKKGDRVSTFMFNTEELGTAFFACAKLGAIFNPINFRLTPEEVAFILSDATPKVVLFEKALEPVISAIENRFEATSFWFIDEEKPAYASSYQEKIAAASSEDIQAEVNENDIYAFIYTSGTTGRPKGVMHSHRNMVDQSVLCIAAQKLEAEDVGLVTAPMFHCAELHCAFLPRIHVGGTERDTSSI